MRALFQDCNNVLFKQYLGLFSALVVFLPGGNRRDHQYVKAAPPRTAFSSTLRSLVQDLSNVPESGSTLWPFDFGQT